VDGEIKLVEKYERNGWPSIQRPDVKPPEGWSLSLITSVNRIHHHQLSPDGKQVAFVWQREELSDIYTMPAAGGWPARLTTGRGPEIDWLDRPPQWSPDGRWLSFTLGDHVHVVPADGRGLPQKVTDFTSSASTPVWMPDSNGLIVTVSRGEASKLLLTDRHGSWPRSLTRGEEGDDWDARPSPDGLFVAYVHRPLDDLNRLDLRLVELTSGAIRSLTGAPKQKDWSPRWSPDGRWLAFLSQRSGFNEVWLIQPDGQGLHQLTKLGLDVGEIAWSPDSRYLALTVNRGGAFDLGLVAIENGALTDLHQGPGVHANVRWAPDGEFLTAEYEEPVKPPDIYRISLSGGRAKQLTFSNPPALACLQQVMPERVSYTSFDGLEIPAFLYRPAHSNGAAILYPHGGPTDQYAYYWDVWAQYFVAKGYTYLAPNFRGSTGYGVAFEHANYDNWGVGDTQDCLHGAKFLRDLDEIDPARIGISGGSYGGYMVISCLSRDPEYLFACGVCRYGDANLFSSWAQCERETRLYTEMQMGHPARRRQIYLDGSPIHQVEAMQKPVLILHGLLDDIVPPQASEEWVEALRRAGKNFEYKTYADEPHGFLRRANQIDALARTERFFDWHLLP
jgi:dipeptidyl aminopeptidase/acylaminoacyl peptidase